jgi:hypothetical protein
MIEGWHGENYLMLFDEAEVASASDRYAILLLFSIHLISHPRFFSGERCSHAF